MKMKLLSMLTAGAALTIMQAQAQMPDTDYLSAYNLLRNPGFELPNTAKITTGFASVPYWDTAPTPAASDSGIDPYWATGASGSWAAYSMATDGDAGVWANQDTGYTLNSGDQLYLSLVAGQNWDGVGGDWHQVDSTLHYQIWTVQDGGPNAGAIYDGAFILAPNNGSGAFNYFSALIPSSALALYVGDTIGISIWNSADDPADNPDAGIITSIGHGSWIDYDDVYLGTEIVPEPGTIALLTLGGLSALVAIRRRRA